MIEAKKVTPKSEEMSERRVAVRKRIVLNMEPALHSGWTVRIRITPQEEIRL
jgi:hypothetical protein